MLASVTRLRVRSVKYLLMFVWKTFLAQRQVVRAPGFFGGTLLLDGRRTFSTLTVRQSERGMQAFRGATPHPTVMPRLVECRDQASYAHWTATVAAVPFCPDA